MAQTPFVGSFSSAARYSYLKVGCFVGYLMMCDHFKILFRI